MINLPSPPKRPFWTPPRIAAIPCLLAGILWVSGGLLPNKETRICYPNEISQTAPAQAPENNAGSKPQIQATKNLMASYGPALAKYGFKQCEIKNGGVDSTLDLKQLFNALGWTVIALGCIPNAISNFTIGKNTRQPSIWAAGLTWLINLPILLFTQSPASLAFSNIALGLLVAGAANQVQNGKLKPGEKTIELPIDTKSGWLALANFVMSDFKRIGRAFLNVATESADYIMQKRKQAPSFIAGFSTIEPNPEQKRIIAGLFGVAAVVALPAMFLTQGGTVLSLSAGNLTTIALEIMGIAGFFDAVTVFQQSCKFKVDRNNKMERAHKKVICMSVAAKGLTDLVSFMAVSDLFLGVKFMILGGSLAEFWNKVDKDGQFSGWLDYSFNQIVETNSQNPAAARTAIKEIAQKATTSADWRKLNVFIEEKARTNPALAQSLGFAAAATVAQAELAAEATA